MPFRFRASIRLDGAQVRSLEHPLVDVQVEQLDEQVLTVRRLVVHEAREISLREDDAAGEFVEAQPEQPLDLCRHAVGIAGENRVGVLEASFLRRCAVLAQLPHDTDGRVLAVADREVEANAHLLPALRDDRKDGTFGEARDGAVQRERQRVDQAGLAGSGWADEREVVGVAEVDLDRLVEGAEPRDLKPERTHAPPRRARRTASARARR